MSDVPHLSDMGRYQLVHQRHALSPKISHAVARDRNGLPAFYAHVDRGNPILQCRDGRRCRAIHYATGPFERREHGLELL